MTIPQTSQPHYLPGAVSDRARDLRWLLTRLVDEVPGLRSVAVVSADGLPLLSSEPVAPAGPDGGAPRPGFGPLGAAADLATVVSGLGSLTGGAAVLMEGGPVKQTLVAMDAGNLLVMSISDGSLLGVYTEPDADMGAVAYQMALFVGRAGHLLTPQLRAELRHASTTVTHPGAHADGPPPPPLPLAGRAATRSSPRASRDRCGPERPVSNSSMVASCSCTDAS